MHRNRGAAMRAVAAQLRQADTIALAAYAAVSTP
jgi:cytochrome c553